MTSQNVGIEEARKTLGDLVTAAQQGTDIILTRNGKPAARLTRYQENAMTAAPETQTAIWSLVTGPSPDAHAVQAEPNDITIPDEVLSWAEEHGFSVNDPDVSLLVALADEAAGIDGEFAYREFPVGDEDAARIRAAVAQLWRDRTEQHNQIQDWA